MKKFSQMLSILYTLYWIRVKKIGGLIHFYFYRYNFVIEIDKNKLILFEHMMKTISRLN